MSKAVKIFRIVANKYVIAIAVFAVLMLFVDRNNIFEQIQRRHQLNELLASKKFYQDEIEKTKQNLNGLKDDAALEKYARETYLMKKKNEDLFIVDSTAANTKK